jgi:cell division transport system ATP-binding protein
MIDDKVIELVNVSVFHATDSSVRAYKPSKRGMRGRELVLSDVNLSVGRGELVYFIGRVGSGKSSLLKMMYGEIALTEGAGYVAGYDLRHLKRKDIPKLRRRMGMVFQDYQLLPDRNVFNNLHYVLRATGWKSDVDMRRRIDEVLTLVGLGNKEYKMPFELSGGEQQRLAIARALLNNPEVILADEPTGNLDPAAAEKVMQIFMKIATGGCSVVMSTHNVNLIEDHPSRTIRFSHGKIEEIDVRSLLGLEC